MSQLKQHLIIGGLGNLGRFLQKHLLEQGVSLRVLDLPSAVQTKAPIERTVSVEPFRLGADSVDQLCRLLEGVETVYNLATPDVQFGTVRELQRTHVQGIHDVLEACPRAGVSQFIHVGSAAAITNSFVDTHQGSETDPLPPLDSYQSYQDLTARIAEEQVLAANTNKVPFQTCSLRLGGILCGSSGYAFRRAMDCPGKIITAASTQRQDFLSGRDASRALWKAHQNMHRVQGQAVLVTRSKDSVAPTLTEVHRYMGQVLDWPVQEVPSWMIQLAKVPIQYQYSLSEVLMTDPPGCPPHLFLELGNYDKTFDNRLAKNSLGMEASQTWKEAVELAFGNFRGRPNADVNTG